MLTFGNPTSASALAQLKTRRKALISEFGEDVPFVVELRDGGP